MPLPRHIYTSAGGLGTAAVLTIIDSVYFGKLKLSLSLRSFSCSGSLTFTILNNYSYNTNTDNLATHGIHPWYQHSLASMPSLFGPLYALAIFKVWSLMKSPSARQHTSYTSMAAAASVVLGLVVLSTVPHQEARFLLPALPGIVICTSSWHRLAPSYFWYAWAVFNTALTIGYGVVHQSGVVPVLGYLSKTSALRSVECKTEHASGDAVCGVALGALDHGTGTRPRLTTHVYTFATYMAPRHLLVQPKTGTSMESRVQLTDLISKTDIEIRDVIRHSVMINKTAALHLDESVERMYRQTSPGHYERALFVMPASVDMQRVVPPDTKEYGLLPIYSFAPHVNFDHIPDILQHPAAKARLNVYLVTTG
ncbi:alpha 1,2 mannosyltransferase [Dipsacomyces acuminosporus]|nr:alpha 1,2 mannosyltransferase [Dipsacomyces acuminosporus]